MTISDYLIAQEGRDWQGMLSAWRWLLPPELTLWLVNRYGEVIFLVPDGSVHHLDVGIGTVKRLAGSREEFFQLLDQDSNAENWLMIPLVDECVQAGLILKPGQCYTYAQPPVLGGDYTTENTRILGLREHLSFYADLHEQLRGLPDGSNVVLRVCDGA